jgi:hypothetical protein
MRKTLGVLFAASMVVSVTVVASGPAGAANTTLPKCKSLQGTQSYTPGLPPTSSNTLVKPVVKTALTITGCTGGGITKGTSDGSAKATVGTNCKKLFADAAAHKPAKATKGVIKWSNGQTSTTSSVLTVTGVTSTGLKAKLVSKYTAGLGKGKTSTVMVNATPNKGWCSSKPFTSVKFKSTSIK